MKTAQENLDLESEREQAFRDLISQVYAQSQAETARRLESNPAPTEEEKNLGFYSEELEYPVRNAVMLLRRKGYSTAWSGFRAGSNDGYQDIRGHFNLDIETIDKLNKIGFSVRQTNTDGRVWCVICFNAQNPDINEMKSKWDQVAESLPDLGRPAEPCKLSKFRKNTGKPL